MHNKLDKELSDVYSEYTFFNIYKYQKFVDAFYDHLITDWVLQNQLKNAVQCLSSAKDQIKRILATLDHDLDKTEDTIFQRTQDKQKIVQSA